MSLVPSQRARAVTESVTLAMSSKANRLRAEGRPVLSFAAGEPDFGTPDHIRDAGIEAIRSGQTRYTAASGMHELRTAGAAWLQREFDLPFGVDEVMVTAGAKPALHLALTALLEPRDRVLVPAPYWVSYPALIELGGGEPVVLPAVPDQGHVHTAEQITTAARAHGAKGIILNYPNNPSGAVPPRDTVADWVRAAAEAGLWILSDEIYGLIVYGDAEHVSPAAVPGGRERTLVVTGGTKSHSLTGWRIGFLAGPEEMIATCGRIQSQVIGNPCTISQHGCLACVTHDDTEALRGRITEFDSRRRFLVDAISDIPGCALSPPEGAFYALVDVRELCAQRKVEDDVLAMLLLEEQNLATIPGSAFGIPGFLRISYAVAMAELEEGMARLRTFAETSKP